MKKLGALLLCMLVFALPAASLELYVASEVAQPVRLSVRRALERAIVPLLKQDETLLADLDASLVLSLRLNDRVLSMTIPTDVQDLQAFLVSNLRYDGLALLDQLPSVHLQFDLERGFAVEDTASFITEGRQYRVLDGQGRSRAVVVASHVRETDPKLAFLQQISGDRLLLGMGLAPMGAFPLSAALSVQADGSLGYEVGASYLLSSYPFWLHLGLLSPDLDQGYMVFGLGASLAMTHLFSSSIPLVRSLSLEGRALAGLGTSFSAGGLLALGEGSLALVYRHNGWAFRLGGGNRLAASGRAVVHQGLFLSLGTSYTYTP